MPNPSPFCPSRLRNAKITLIVRAKTGFLYPLLLLLCVPAWAGVQILDVGLQRFHPRFGQTCIAVRIFNPPDATGPFHLRILLQKLIEPPPPAPRQLVTVQSLDVSIPMAPGEIRNVNIPITIDPDAQDVSRIEVQELDSSGKAVGLGPYIDTGAVSEPVIAVVCRPWTVCEKLNIELRKLSSVREDRPGYRAPRFIFVLEPRDTWLAYTAARWVIVATKPKPGPQKAALEEYARMGGTLIVTGGDRSDFLRPYRTSEGQARIGRGCVLFMKEGRIGSSAFFRKALSALIENSDSNARFVKIGDHFGGVGRETGGLVTSFNFPSLQWLIAWLVVYILVVGVANFVVLRRIGRREWGWVTVPAIALAFASVLYVLSVGRHPAVFRIDQIEFLWMDGASPLASSKNDVRVWSPHSQWLTLRATDELPISWLSAEVGSPVSEFSEGLRHSRRRNAPREFNISLNASGFQSVPLRLPRYSFADAGFDAIRRLPGTVEFAGGPLRNNTGENFSDAILTNMAGTFYVDLGAVPSGAVISPAQFAGPPSKAPDVLSEREFSLKKFLRANISDSLMSQEDLVFIGISHPAPSGDFSLESIPAEERHYRLVFVDLGVPTSKAGWK